MPNLGLELQATCLGEKRTKIISIGHGVPCSTLMPSTILATNSERAKDISFSRAYITMSGKISNDVSHSFAYC